MRGSQASIGIRAPICMILAAAGLVPFSGCIYHPRYEVALPGLFDIPATTLTESSETMPYAWAVPILAAWDFTYICDDHNVAHAGAMLDSFSGAPTGTLRYRVTT